jgi:predicted TIM-barrel fold metal-dependent hydrolase
MIRVKARTWAGAKLTFKDLAWKASSVLEEPGSLPVVLGHCSIKVDPLWQIQSIAKIEV